MSQIISQDTPPLQNRTNTFNQPSVSSKDTPTNASMKPSRIFIDLTSTKLTDPDSPKRNESKNSSRFKTSATIIEPIVISDSDDESPPKRLKNNETPKSTPQKASPNIHSNLKHPKNVSVTRSPSLNPRISSTHPSKTSSNTQSTIKHSTPLLGNGSLCESHLSSPVLNSIGSNASLESPLLSAIMNPADMPNVFEEEQLMPTDVTTVELFASNSSSQLKKQLITPEFAIENSNHSSLLPEPNFLPDREQQTPSSSQLADQLHYVAIQDSPEQKLRRSPKTSKPSSTDSFNFYTPTASPLPLSSPEDSVFFTPCPSRSSSGSLALDKLEENRKRYLPGRIHPVLSSCLTEGRELPAEWIDHMINLPLESQTSFIKINSLQFVHSYISTPRIKISSSLLAPLVSCLTRTQDENVIVPLATLLRDVIKAHPAVTASNTVCYGSVFTWEILTTSLEMVLGSDQLLMPFDSLLNVYCDVMVSENSSQLCNHKHSFIRALFWSASSAINLCTNLKSLIDYTSKLFFKQSSSVRWLFTMLEQVLEWSLRENEVIWHEEATLEFRNQFSSLDSLSYSQLLGTINPPWFAGFLAQKRLQEICVSPKLNLQLSHSLSELFCNFANALPSHTNLEVPGPSIQTSPLDSLIKASHNGNCDGIHQLIQEGCNPNACDCKKWSSLHRACYSGEFKSIEAIVQASKEKGIYLNIIQKNALGATPLHIAAKCGNTAVCRCLLNIGGPSLLFQRDGYQKTPSQVATDAVLSKSLTISSDEAFLANFPLEADVKTNSLRVPIDLAIIHEFESMLCLTIYGIFIQGKFTQEDLLVCQRAEKFILNLRRKINKSQSEPVELRRLTTLIHSLFA